MNSPRSSSVAADAGDENQDRKRIRVVHRLGKILSSRRWLIIPPIVLGLFVVVTMVRSKKEIPRVEIPEQSVKVAVVDAQLEDIQTRVVGFGTAMPSRNWTAIAEVSGRIVWVHPDLDSGNAVKAGETLVRIDDRDYQLRLSQRIADLDSSKANLAELKANELADRKSLTIETNLQTVSKKDLLRMRRLREANAISNSELDAAESTLLRQDQQVQQLENMLTLYPSKIESARAKVAMAESVVDETRRNIERTEIKSAVAGVLSGVDLEVGQVVSPNQKLFQVLDDQEIEIEAQISLSQLHQLAGQVPGRVSPGFAATNWISEIDATITSQSGSDTFRWQGTPIRVTESLDEQTRTVGVVVKVDNRSQAGIQNRKEKTDSSSDVGLTSHENPRDDFSQLPLKSGTYCKVTFTGKSRTKAIAIPRTAFEGEQVFIVDNESRLQVRDIVRGPSIGDRIIVRSGIEPGDRVVVRPPIPAIEGMLLRLPQ